MSETSTSFLALFQKKNSITFAVSFWSFSQPLKAHCYSQQGLFTFNIFNQAALYA